MYTFFGDERVHALVASFYEEGKVTAVICHATCVLLKTRLSDGRLLVEGKTWTGFANSEERYADEFVNQKGYGPLSTGLRLLPVATTVGITSVVGTKLAVRSGTKLVVAGGLAALAAGLAWTSSASARTSYLTIAGQMILIGAGIGLTTTCRSGSSGSSKTVRGSPLG
jgi:putative intracellular protease/amidase